MDLNHFLIKWVAFLLMCILTAGCFSEKSKSWNVINAKLEAELEIGNDSTAFLSHPAFLDVDSNGNIIVADRGRSELLVFKSNGEFSHVIGRRGPGPSEFRDIKGMAVNENDEITVFDGGSQTIKKFSVSGRYLKSYILSSTISTNVKFRPWENFQFLFFINPNPGVDQNYLLHLYSKDYERLITDEILLQDLEYFNEQIIPLLIKSVGNNLVLKNRLLFTPAVYNGNIYEYVLSRSDSSVKYAGKIPGYIHREPINIVGRDQSNISEYADIKVSNPETTLRLLVHNRSKGLFKLKDGNIIHFTYIADSEGSKRVFGFELYDQALNSLGYGSLETKPFSNNPEANNLLGWDVMAKDEDDRFYIIDTSLNIPKIRVMRLTF